MAVLDIGCGPGTITVDLARRVGAGIGTGTVLGLDLSAAPLDEARELATREGVAAEFRVGDVYALEAPDDSYDVVHAHQVLQHLTDPVAALREMARVCRPGGLVAVRDVDCAATTWFPADQALDAWPALYRRVARRNGAGDATASAWCFSTPDERGWWGRSWAGRATATASAFGEQARSYGLAGDDDLQAIADGWLRWAVAPDGWLGLLHGELLSRLPD